MLPLRRRVSLLHDALVADRDALHLLDADRATLADVAVKQRGIGLAPPHTDKLLAEIDGVVDARVEAEPAERVVEVRGIAREQHAAVAEILGDALMHPVSTLVADVVTLRS